MHLSIYFLWKGKLFQLVKYTLYQTEQTIDKFWFLLPLDVEAIIYKTSFIIPVG